MPPTSGVSARPWPVLLWSLYFDQPCGRQDLGHATGLSPASVSNVIRELIDMGTVVESGSVESDGDRPVDAGDGTGWTGRAAGGRDRRRRTGAFGVSRRYGARRAELAIKRNRAASGAWQLSESSGRFRGNECSVPIPPLFP